LRSGSLAEDRGGRGAGGHNSVQLRRLAPMMRLTMSEQPPPEERLSPDGLWRWDGQNWVTAELSADGRSRWDGYDWRPVPQASVQALAVIQPSAPAAGDVLQGTAAYYVQRGFRVVNQTPTSVQLVRPKKFSFLWAVAWFFLCGFGVLVYIFYYMGKRDSQIYLSVDQWGRLNETAS
jgi:hypothetical protein